jgi:hypothetical protein
LNYTIYLVLYFIKISRVVKSINSMSHAKKQQNTRGEKIEVLLEHMDHVIVTARGSDLNQAIADMIVIREELEAFRPTHYSNSDSSSSDS